MPDIFVLSKIAEPITIGGVEHFVAWDSLHNRAVIMYINDDKLLDLHDSNGNTMVFSCELEAHRYMVGLKIEVDGEEEEPWTNLLLE